MKKLLKVLGVIVLSILVLLLMVTSAKITPDKETGIGLWSKDAFVQHFALYRDSTNAHQSIKQRELQTIMPWTMYGNMTDKDL